MSNSEDSENKSAKPPTDLLVPSKPGGSKDSEHYCAQYAEIFMFAEDLFDYILKQFHDISYPRVGLEDCRNLVYNAFNETVKKAVHFIRWQIKNPSVLPPFSTKEICLTRKDEYRTVVERVFNQYAVNGLNAGLFLYYCVYFAELASGFESSEIAVFSILDAFAMTTEGWKELNVIAGKIVRLSKDRSLYPDYKPQRRDRSLSSITDVADAEVSVRCSEAYQSNPEKDSENLSAVVENTEPVGEECEEDNHSLLLANHENTQAHYVSGKLKGDKSFDDASLSANVSSSENSGELSDPLNDSEIEDLQCLEIESRLTLNHDYSDFTNTIFDLDENDDDDMSSSIAEEESEVSYDGSRSQSDS